MLFFESRIFRQRTFRRAWLGIALSVLALVLVVLALSPAQASGGDTVSLCRGAEKLWLNATIDGSDRMISLCSTSSSRSARGLQFRLGRPGQIEIVYPKQAKRPRDAFIYRRYTRYRTTYLKLEFFVAGLHYAILEWDSDGEYSASFRIRRIKDEKDLSEEPIQMQTGRFVMMRLENVVKTKPFDE